jgi:hypothetical protein
VRLENSYWNSALSPVDMGDFKILVDEGATLDTNWRWQTFVTGLRRTLDYAGDDSFKTDFFEARNRFFRLGPDGNELELNYDFRLRSSDEVRDTTSNEVGASYRWNVSTAWQLRPFAQVTDLTTGSSSTFAPRVGLTASWRWARPAVQVTLSPGAAYGRPRFETSGSSYTKSNLNLVFTGVVGSGENRGLRKEFEFEVSRNDLRLLSSPIEDLPDLGLSSAEIGVHDSYRARFTLRHHWDGVQFDTWADWFRTERPATNDLGEFTSQTLMGNLQFTGRRATITGNIGHTETGSGPETEQQVGFYGVGATYRPWRHLVLHAWYSGTTREVFVAPDIDGETYKAGLRYQWGRFYLGGEYFQTSDRSPGGPDFSSRGFQWSLSTQFAGRLPIVSSVKRRGVIR